MTSMLGGYTKEIVIGALAVVSLFMVMMMVRKSAPAPVAIAAAAVPAGPAVVLEPTEMIAGEVGGSDAALDGMELDDDAIRTQQMLEQVGTLVSDNPDAAASLVKRWLNRS